MANKTEFVNMVLGLLAERTVAALEQPDLDRSEAAQKVLQQCEAARDEVLAQHGWLCALEYITLLQAADAAPGDWKFPYRYRLPGDALGVWTVNLCPGSPLAPERWAYGTKDEDGGVVRMIKASVSGDLQVAYIRRCSWEALDPHVLTAIAMLTAARACGPINGDKAQAAQLENRANSRLLTAISVDGRHAAGDDPVIVTNLRAMRQAATE